MQNLSWPSLYLFNFRLKCLNVPTHTKLLSAVFQQQPGSANQYPCSKENWWPHCCCAYDDMKWSHKIFTHSNKNRSMYTKAGTTHSLIIIINIMDYANMLICIMSVGVSKQRFARCKLIQTSKAQWHCLTHCPCSVYCIVVNYSVQDSLKSNVGRFYSVSRHMENRGTVCQINGKGTKAAHWLVINLKLTCCWW